VGSALFGVVHDDLLAALNGHAMARGLITTLTAKFGAGFSAGIDADDFVFIEHDSTDFEIASDAYPGSNAQFGYPAGGTGLAGGIAPFRHTGSLG